MTTTMMTKTTSRANLLNDFASQRDEQIINGKRFGDDVEMMVLCLHGDDVESTALFPSYADLEAGGYGVGTIAAALESQVITASELGDLIAELSVDDVNNSVLTSMLCHYDGCELDMADVRAAGCDDEPIATALCAGVLSKPQLMSMLRHQQPGDIDTAVQYLLGAA